MFTKKYITRHFNYLKSSCLNTFPSVSFSQYNHRFYAVELGDTAFQNYLKKYRDSQKTETHDPNAPFAFPSEEERLSRRKSPFIVQPQRPINIDEFVEPSRPTRPSADRTGQYLPPHHNKRKLNEEELKEVYDYNQKMRKIYSEEMQELKNRKSEGEIYVVPDLVIRVKDMQRYAAKIISLGYKQWKPVDKFPNFLEPENLEEAFSIQRAISEEMQYQVAGWKIGAPAKSTQEAMGLSSPFIGPIYDKFVWQSPTTLNMDKLIVFSPKVEVEICLIMRGNLKITDGMNEDGSSKLRTKDFTLDEILNDIEAVVPMIEIIGNRLDPVVTKDCNSFTKIADNGSNVGVVIGEPNKEFADMLREDYNAWKKVNIELKINGESISKNDSKYVHENGPAGSAVWIANFLKSQGHFIRKGDFIATGTLVTPERVTKNDILEVDCGILGNLEVNFKGTTLVRMKNLNKREKLVTKSVNFD